MKDLRNVLNFAGYFFVGLLCLSAAICASFSIFFPGLKSTWKDYAVLPFSIVGMAVFAYETIIAAVKIFAENHKISTTIHEIYINPDENGGRNVFRCK